jgi:hypothetical protein
VKWRWEYTLKRTVPLIVVPLVVPAGAVVDKRRFGRSSWRFVSFGWEFWSGSSLGLDGVIVSHINMPSLWWLVVLGGIVDRFMWGYWYS